MYLQAGSCRTAEGPGNFQEDKGQHDVILPGRGESVLAGLSLTATVEIAGGRGPAVHLPNSFCKTRLLQEALPDPQSGIDAPPACPLYHNYLCVSLARQ